MSDEPTPTEAPRAPKLQDLRRELGSRRGWGLVHTYARVTVYQREDGTEAAIATVYASRTGEQGRAHECVAGTGSSIAEAIADLAARAAELPPPTERKNDGHATKPGAKRNSTNDANADAIDVRRDPHRPDL